MKDQTSATSPLPDVASNAAYTKQEVKIQNTSSPKNTPEDNTFIKNVVPKWSRILLLFALAYEGAGAIAGGILLVLAPDGRYMDMPVEIMNGVFHDFLIPGIILTGLGILNSIAFFAVLKKNAADWIMACLSMGGLAIWFVVEIIVLNGLHWLHFMWGFPVFIGIVGAIPLIAFRNASHQPDKFLLTCGLVSSIWYLLINIIVPPFDTAYSSVTQTVSELSAIHAPTRVIWILLSLPYGVLYAAFGLGILRMKSLNRPLKTAGLLILLYSFITFYWPPMQLRGQEMKLTDMMHITWGFITVSFMIAKLSLGIAGLEKSLRKYSIVSLVLFVITGILIALEAPQIAVNEPTPLIGFWERLNILIFMTWIAVLSVHLRRSLLLNSKKTS